ncbi:MAG: BON domain-containing protein [Acidobacteriota bacterium]|jgi:outer membrane biogenesis lipoprotein LolB|nr:BON domain-containing protein [Acidobacteriota bacterium]
MKKFTILSCVILLAMVLIGCETMPETESNKAVMTDETNVTVDGATTDNEIVDADADDDWDWDNDLTRENYDKDTAKYDTYRGKRYKDDTVGSGANDSWLWTKTRASLATTAGLRETTINVDVEDAVVTLRGTVGSDKELKDAVKMANDIDGVKRVKNELKVAPADSVTNMASDTDNMDNDANTNK